jgi:hypothetical protein
MRAILIAITALSLAGCHGSANSVLSQLTIATVGHDTPFVTPDEPEEDIPVPPVEPAVEPPVYVPPLTEECEPGTHGFRLWDCVDGHRVYW